jgi:glycosyltransferase involved in cell wall biosynthesis
VSLTRGPVVLDIQALQSPDFRGRGVARYAYELATALERDHPELLGAYLLNPDLPPPGDLGPLLGSAKVDYAGSPSAVRDGARLLHVLSPFELQVPIDRVWPRWAHEAGLRFCATVYDLIPLEHQHPYLDDVRQRARYLGRLEVLRAADALLTISPATSRSLVANLGIDPERIHMVGAGTSRRFAPAASPEDAQAQAQRHVPGLEAAFVLYPGGSDGRKNVEALIRAFALLPKPLRRTRQLVVAGQLPELRANHFRHLAATEGIRDRLLLTGHVSDETMLQLYQATELLCFPSLIEGYGLPVAEAMACGAVAIVSDVDPLRDLVTADARFDPSDPAAIAAAIERALTSHEFREAARQHGLARRTTWEEVANRTVATYRALLARPSRPSARRRRRRVAIFSPFPPLASGIANYSFRLVEELDRLSDLDIDCFADGLDRSPGPIEAPSGLESYDARWFARMEGLTAGYDEVVYVLGNSEYHTAALAALRRRSGIVLAHEVRLSGLYRFAADSTSAVPEGIEGTIRRIYGPLMPEGLASSGQVTATEAELYGLLMAREVIGLSECFLVTSHAAARLARVDAGPALASRVEVLPFATEILRTESEPPAALGGAPPGARVLASFGIVDPIKQPHRLVGCLAELATDHPEVVLALVGPVSIGLTRELRRLGEELGVADRLIITGRVDAGVYLAWLDRAELAVQLRASFSGEASAAVGDCLARGLPMIVTDIGWLGELPDDAAAKVPVDVAPSALAQACRRLLDEPGAREALGKGARSYALSHSFEAAARALLAILSQSERAGRNTA